MVENLKNRGERSSGILACTQLKTNCRRLNSAGSHRLSRIEKQLVNCGPRRRGRRRCPIERLSAFASISLLMKFRPTAARPAINTKIENSFNILINVIPPMLSNFRSLPGPASAALFENKLISAAPVIKREYRGAARAEKYRRATEITRATIKGFYF